MLKIVTKLYAGNQHTCSLPLFPLNLNIGFFRFPFCQLSRHGHCAVLICSCVMHSPPSSQKLLYFLPWQVFEKICTSLSCRLTAVSMVWWNRELLDTRSQGEHDHTSWLWVFILITVTTQICTCDIFHKVCKTYFLWKLVMVNFVVMYIYISDYSLAN